MTENETVMDTGLLIAIMTSIVSLVVATISIVGGRRNEQALEKLRAGLTEAQAERDARRDYEYEARKRLYQEFEPLLFQFLELGQEAADRIVGLARTARQGNLDPDHGWLTRDSYYMRSTIYRLMAPLVIAKLMQRRLTLVDMQVDPRIRVQYSLTRVLYNSFSDHHALAKRDPALDYDPNAGVSDDIRRQNPAKYYAQGLFSMYLDTIVDTLIVQEEHNPPRCMSFGEFESVYPSESSDVLRSYGQVRSLFCGFHPQERPVLWRILITQAHLYRALYKLINQAAFSLDTDSLPISPEERKEYDWRQEGSRSSDKEALSDPFTAAEGYLRKQLEITLLIDDGHKHP
jgi:hypothetical protein